MLIKEEVKFYIGTQKKTIQKKETPEAAVLDK